MSVLSQRFFSERSQLPPEPARLRRTLSLSYHWNGGESNIDPRGCTDAVERYERESAFLRDHPNTPYAQGIREERANEHAAAMRYI
jgi:hypothetical protein